MTQHILVADDYPLVRYTLIRGLTKAGYRVSEAGDGEQALARCQQTPPDLALLDIRMPGLGGIELARRLREFGVPVVFLTAYSDRETVEAGIREGALGYLVKPLEMKQILPSLEAALARAEELGKLRRNESKLVDALQRSRGISIAVGLLMRRYTLPPRRPSSCYAALPATSGDVSTTSRMNW